MSNKPTLTDLLVQAGLRKAVKQLLHRSYENRFAVQESFRQFRVSLTRRDPKLLGLLTRLIDKKIIRTQIYRRSLTRIQA
jgi:hypothetical protein